MAVMNERNSPGGSAEDESEVGGWNNVVEIKGKRARSCAVAARQLAIQLTNIECLTVGWLQYV
jgi:hypothetical protein